MKVFAGLVVALFLLAGGGAVAAWLAAPSLLRPPLEAALTKATGHQARVGNVRPLWDGGLVIEARDVSIVNAPWGSRSTMMTAPRIRAALDLVGLPRGRLRIASVRVDSPDLLLETDAAGHGNWERPAATPQMSGETGPQWLQTELGTVTVSAGRLVFHDGRSRRSLEGQVSGDINPADPLRGSTVAFSGRVLLPDPLDTDIKLSPGRPDPGLVVRVSSGGAQATASGAMDPVTLRPVGPLAVEGQADDLAALAARFGWPGIAGAGSAQARIVWRGKAVSLHGVRLTLPGGTLTGDLDVELAPRPALRGTLHADRLDLDAVHLADPPATPQSSAAPVTTPPATAVPQAALPWDALTVADADVVFRATELRLRGIEFRDLSAHVLANDGDVRLDPVTATAPGGHVDATAHAVAMAQPPTIAIMLHAPSLAMAPVMAAAGLPGGLTGTAALQIDAHADGATVAALRDSAAGHASVVMGGGDLELALLAPLLRATHLPFAVSGHATLRCVVLRGELRGGVVAAAPLVIDATRLLVEGEGTVDLAHRSLSLHLRPLLRTGPGLVVPVVVTGPWAAPRLDVERTGVEAVLGALAGAAGAGSGHDACAAAGIASAVPLPPAKPLKPVDLLRSLLR